MRLIASIISSAILLGFVIPTNCMAQNKKDSIHFPTYEEIRGDKSETIDYVAPRKLSNGYQPVITKTIIVDKYWNAFNYPTNSAVYYLNGRQVKSQNDAKKELDKPSLIIERVAIGEVGANGKRKIEIDYKMRPKN